LFNYHISFVAVNLLLSLIQAYEFLEQVKTEPLRELRLGSDDRWFPR
jgi:hypothetical protein